MNTRKMLFKAQIVVLLTMITFPLATVSAEISIYEAEDCSSNTGGGVKVGENAYWDGYTGDGYFDMGVNGSWFEWDNIDAGSGGAFTLIFRYAAASDRPCEISVNGIPVGTVGFSETGGWSSWLTDSIDVVLNSGLNTIRVTASTGNGGPNADNMQLSLSRLSYEAEDLVLSNYIIQSSEYASNGQYVETAGTGIAATDFSGPAAIAGQYYINTYYFDMTGGQSTYTLSINGTTADTWTADKNLGSSSIGESTYVCHQTLVTLSTGDVIEVQGIADGSEGATLDKLDMAPVVRENYEAESSVLSEYTVQDGIAGSSAQYVQTTDSGSVTATFMSYPGAYDLEIYYFDENDGSSSYTLQVDGATVDTWLAESDFNSDKPHDNCRTCRKVYAVELAQGSEITVQGISDGAEHATLDNIVVKTSSNLTPPNSSFAFSDSTGLPLTLLLNGQEYLAGTSTDDGFTFKVFDGYSVDEYVCQNVTVNGNTMIVSGENGPRFTFDIKEYDHHVNLSLINIEALPLNDSSVALRLDIPVSSKVNVVDLDTNAVSASSNSSVSVYWKQMGTRDGIFPYGSLALYAEGDIAAIGEIESTANSIVYGIADFHHDGYVDLLDFSKLAMAWMSDGSGPDFDYACDMVIDDSIDIQDVARFAQHWLGSTPQTYQLTVNNGAGSGDYTQSSVVTITADTPPGGTVFTGWSGDIAYLADSGAAETTVTMPSKPIAVTAAYGSSTTTYQAEDAESTSGCAKKIEPNVQWSGYTGTGYIDMGGSGSYFQWDDSISGNGGVCTLTFRYASSTNRPCDISVNGTVVGTVYFNATGSFKSWVTESIDVSLDTGLNTIRVTAATSAGGPNVDAMDVTF